MQLFQPRFYELKAVSTLPSAAALGAEIARVSGQASATIEDFTRLAQADPASAGRVIKLANSTSLGRPAVSIAEAVRRLGVASARSACLAFSVVEKSPPGPCWEFGYDRFWSQSYARAVAIRELAGRLEIVSPDEAYAFGLVAKMGELALATIYPKECAKLLAEGTTRYDFAERLSKENTRFGATSVQLSAALLSDWRLPVFFVDAVLETAQPSELALSSLSRHRQLARLLNVSNHIASFCIESSQSIVSPPPALCLELKRLQIDMSDLKGICDRVTSDLKKWTEVTKPPVASTESAVTTSAVGRPLPASVEQSPSPLTILLAEDNEAQRKLMSHVLRSAGHTVIASENGQTALRLALQNQPDIVIADWQMPGMDGLELCSALRRTKVGLGMYFILVTGEPDEGVFMQAFETGVDDFVGKPLLPRAFQAKMKSAQRLLRVEAEIRNERAELRRVTAELVIANRRLESASLTDSLTDLPNRRFLMQQFELHWSTAAAQNRRLSCLLIDVDHFKSINDQYGHAIGDVVLKELATSFRRHKRDEDIACRYGGEEFAVILPNTDSDTAYQVAERLRFAAEREVGPQFPVLTQPVTISVGLASRTSKTASANELLDRADQALYRAKGEGRNRTCVAQSSEEERDVNATVAATRAAVGRHFRSSMVAASAGPTS
jgi:two-component system, cell cycle response regulator